MLSICITRHPKENPTSYTASYTGTNTTIQYMQSLHRREPSTKLDISNATAHSAPPQSLDIFQSSLPTTPSVTAGCSASRIARARVARVMPAPVPVPECCVITKLVNALHETVYRVRLPFLDLPGEKKKSVRTSNSDTASACEFRPACKLTTLCLEPLSPFPFPFP